MPVAPPVGRRASPGGRGLDVTLAECTGLDQQGVGKGSSCWKYFMQPYCYGLPSSSPQIGHGLLVRQHVPKNGLPLKGNG